MHDRAADQTLVRRLRAGDGSAVRDLAEAPSIAKQIAEALQAASKWLTSVTWRAKGPFSQIGETERDF